jgi:ribonucleotide reductase beta subunit family protein with ferritin-like domain
MDHIAQIVNYLPTQDAELYELFLKGIRTFWSHEEIDLSVDSISWNTILDDKERFLLSRILAFFSASDQLVNMNLSDRFKVDIQTELPAQYRPCAELFYNYQLLDETIHSLTYETLINTLITDRDQHDQLKNAVIHIPAIEKKAKWASKFINDTTSTFPLRLVAFAAVEGIMFSGSFCAIYWIDEKHRNKLPGLVQSNKFISQDEHLHYEFACALFKKIRNHDVEGFNVSETQVTELVMDAVGIEIEFITESIPVSMIGMNSVMMGDYIKYVADNLMKDLGYAPIYNIDSCPFTFMNMLSMPTRANFFECRDTSYSKPVSYDAIDDDLF